MPMSWSLASSLPAFFFSVSRVANDGDSLEGAPHLCRVRPLSRSGRSSPSWNVIAVLGDHLRGLLLVVYHLQYSQLLQIKPSCYSRSTVWKDKDSLSLPRFQTSRRSRPVLPTGASRKRRIEEYVHKSNGTDSNTASFPAGL